MVVRDDAGRSVATLTAKTPGTSGNEIRLAVDAAEDDCRIDDETLSSSFVRLNYVRIVPSAENRIRILRGQTRRTETPDIVYKQVVTDEVVTANINNRLFLLQQTGGAGAADQRRARAGRGRYAGSRVQGNLDLVQRRDHAPAGESDPDQYRLR